MRPDQLKPMLGKLTRELPRDGYLYEPKWDGFRCLVFRDGDGVDLRSRHGRPLARYFPEIVEAAKDLQSGTLVLDGEIVLEGEHDFTALMSRLHPAASRVEQLSAERPTLLIAFDLLVIGGRDVAGEPFRFRRETLEAELGAAEGRVRLTPITDEPERAADWLRGGPASGIDGVMAKRPDSPYRPGARAMLKVKLERTADCVVAGYRPLLDEPGIASLLLGLYDDAGELRHVGVASSFSRRRALELLAELDEVRVPLAGHPWEHGYLTGGGHVGRLPGSAGRWDPEEMELDWAPLAPIRVCEVAYDHLEHDRFRHSARFRRWRADREPRSCTFAQLDQRSSPGAASASPGR